MPNLEICESARNKAHMTPCFEDWKRFCFTLRKIAKGENGRALSGAEAQKRARTVLVECGYEWSGYMPAGEPVTAAEQSPRPKRTRAS